MGEQALRSYIGSTPWRNVFPQAGAAESCPRQSHSADSQANTVNRDPFTFIRDYPMTECLLSQGNGSAGTSGLKPNTGLKCLSGVSRRVQHPLSGRREVKSDITRTS